METNIDPETRNEDEDLARERRSRSRLVARRLPLLALLFVVSAALPIRWARKHLSGCVSHESSLSPTASDVRLFLASSAFN